MSTRHPGRPKKEGELLSCRAEGCTHKATGSKGFCQTHYIYSRKGITDPITGARLREPKRVARYSQDAICFLPGCGGRPRNRGMCNRHALQREAGIIDERGNQLRELAPTGRKRERERWISSTRDGYVLRVAPENHPHVRADGTILEHRLVMEQQLGRYLEEWEIVHHKDGNRSNNGPSNLQLVDGRAKRGEGHHPGHEFSPLVAIQVLLQQSDVPDGFRQWLEWYKTSLMGQKTAA